MKQYFSAGCWCGGCGGVWPVAGGRTATHCGGEGDWGHTASDTKEPEHGDRSSAQCAPSYLGAHTGEALFPTDSICKCWLLHLWFYICSVVMLQLQWGAAAKV